MKANLLRDLNHPFIVSYKDSFIESGLLIIIMEYCEGTSSTNKIINNMVEGDLAFHIKRQK